MKHHHCPYCKGPSGPWSPAHIFHRWRAEREQCWVTWLHMAAPIDLLWGNIEHQEALIPDISPSWNPQSQCVLFSKLSYIFLLLRHKDVESWGNTVMLLAPARPDTQIHLLLVGGSRITHSCLKSILEVGPGEQQPSGRHALLGRPSLCF